MNRTVKNIALMALIAALAGCGGGSTSSFAGSGSAGGSSSGGSGTGTTGSVSIGSGSGSSFQKGTLAIGIGSSTLSAGGSTSITATIVNTDGSLYSQSVTVSFNSPCVSSGLASILDATSGVSSPTSSVTTSTGTATATYTAKGCSGSDTITATASINGTSISATGTVTVQAAQLGSIQFVSATPSTIALKGMGGVGAAESSTVVFKVLDTTGGIKPNTTVAFSLSTTVGGISLSATSAKSDASGLVQTVVQSGTVSTPVSVIATVQATTGPISTQSLGLTISSGQPSQKAFSLAVEKHNIEAWDKVGSPSETVSVQLGDRFNNPVPDGTTVQFTTDGGIIDPSCTTVGGACTVTWRPGSPQPANGRAIIMAYTIGEEGFTDVNGNGVFDAGDSFTDEGEVFEDDNENGTRDSGEPFYDFNSNNVYDGPDGKYEGINCQHPTLCGSRSSTGIGANNVIVISSGAAKVTVLSSANYDSTTNTLTAPGSLQLLISDKNGNPMAAGTTFAVATTNGSITSNTSFAPVPDETSLGSNDVIEIDVAPDGTPSTGTLTITIVSTTVTTTYTVKVVD